MHRVTLFAIASVVLATIENVFVLYLEFLVRGSINDNSQPMEEISS